MSRLLIKNAIVLTMEPGAAAPKVQDILVTGSTIEAIGPNLGEGTADIDETIDADGTIAIPGLINAHIHLWQSGLRGIAGNWTFGDYFVGMLLGISSRVDARDLYLANSVGAAEQIDFGITTIFDWSHALHEEDYADAAVAALSESGIRAVFGYGTPGNDVAKWWHDSTTPHPKEARRTADVLRSHERLTFGLAIRGPDFSNDDVTAADIALARDLGAIASMHIGTDSSRANQIDGVARLEKLGLLGPDLNLVHANNITDTELAAVIRSGASITVTPEVEVQMGMGFPVTSRLLAAGGAPTLGTDVASAVSADLFNQMRLTLQLHRGLSHADAFADGTAGTPAIMHASDVLGFATREAAKALGLEKSVGTLAPGKRADIVLMRPGSSANTTPILDPYEAVVLQCHAGNVDTVLIDGQVLKRNFVLTKTPDIDAQAELAGRMEAVAAPLPAT